jgi:formylglycine-generating enzyme required for sulfatase activity
MVILLFNSCKTDLHKEIEISIAENISLEMVLISPGSFIMGSDSTEQERHNDEDPMREVTISKPFYMGKYEVTQEQWKAVMGDNPSMFKDKENWNDHPVDWVSWNDCIEFTEKLSQLTSKIFRLPTEAEWEYACRAGTDTRYYWGNDPNDWEVRDYAWAFSYSEGRSHPVGMKKPNAWGLYDMSGNMWEWCLDWRAPYDPQDIVDPKGQTNGNKKIYRGGSWFNNPQLLPPPPISSLHNHHHPQSRIRPLCIRLMPVPVSRAQG